MTMTTSDLLAMKNLLEAGRDAGCPMDQMDNFVKARYVPIPGMLQFHAAAREADVTGGPIYIAIGGKRGPGKSHACISQVGLDDCQRYPGLKVLFLRKVMKSASESLEDLVSRVFRYTKHEFVNSQVIFDNGSRIVLGGYNYEKDIDKYLGIEYDVIVIEEATQISEGKISAIRGSLRTSKPGWRPRMYLTTNPDGIGLMWFKRDLVTPSRNRQETDTRFFDVSYINNPFINKEYDQWLATLKGPLAAAWARGDWDAFSGMAFPMWNRERHVIKPMTPPTHWPKWRAIDWGKAAPFVCLWLTKNPDTKQIIVYKEAYYTELTDRQQAVMINTMTMPDEVIFTSYADPSLWTKRDQQGVWKSTADTYEEEGIYLEKGDNQRIQGKRKFDQALSDQANGEPGLVYTENCEHAIEEIENMPRSKSNPEDVDTAAPDHAYDAGRYGLTNTDIIPTAPDRHSKRVTKPATDNMAYI